MQRVAEGASALQQRLRHVSVIFSRRGVLQEVAEDERGTLPSKFQALVKIEEVRGEADTVPYLSWTRSAQGL